MHEIVNYLSGLSDLGLGAVGVALYLKLSETLTAITKTLGILEHRVTEVEKEVDTLKQRGVFRGAA